jgi:4-amino-4-deoxy-L-arabinose transferase-like glycosyltransferase
LSEAPESSRLLTAGLLAFLGVMAVARFVALTHDPAYAIVSPSATFLTDEGWYTKAAQLDAKFGQYTQIGDFVWLSHNPLFTLLVRLSFAIFGVSAEAARAVSGVSWIVAISAFYLICRTTQPRTIALGACALVSLTLHNLTYSRLALIEPSATAFTLVGILLWVRFPRSVPAAPFVLALGSAAVFCKVSFLFSLIAVSMLVAGDGVMSFREGRKGRAALLWVLVAANAYVTWLLHQRAIAWAGEAGELFHRWHVAPRSGGMQIKPVIGNEMKMLYKLFEATGAPVITGAALFALAFLGRARKLRPRFPVSRATLALLLWGVGGCTFFGLFGTQSPRYFYFALFPITYVALMLAREVAGDRRWPTALVLLIVLHGATQLEGYVLWARRANRWSARDMAQDIIRRMEIPADADEAILMGGTASNVALHDARIRPLDFRPEDFLPERLEHWRPRFLVASKSNAERALEFAPDVIERLELVAQYRLMENYYTQEDHVLLRIHYKSE